MMGKKNQSSKNWVSFRVKPEEYQKIKSQFSNTTHRSISEYARKVLLNKPVTVRYRNESADEFLAVVLGLKKELNAIGNNYNQAVKRLNNTAHIAEVKSWLIRSEADHKAICHQVEKILDTCYQFYRRMLSG